MDATEKIITDYAERYAGHPMDKYHDAHLYAEAYKHFEAGLNHNTSQLQQRISELEKERGKLKEHKQNYQETVLHHFEEIESINKENERLKRVIGGKLYWIWKGSDTDLDFTEWEQQFKTENNL